MFSPSLLPFWQRKKNLHTEYCPFQNKGDILKYFTYTTDCLFLPNLYYLCDRTSMVYLNVTVKRKTRSLQYQTRSSLVIMSLIILIPKKWTVLFHFWSAMQLKKNNNVFGARQQEKLAPMVLAPFWPVVSK